MDTNPTTPPTAVQRTAATDLPNLRPAASRAERLGMTAATVTGLTALAALIVAAVTW